MLTIPKRGEGVFPPYWYRGTRDGAPQVFFRCGCGRKGSLTKSHEISPDGYVSPSVWCAPEDGGCGYHTSIRLEGFST